MASSRGSTASSKPPKQRLAVTAQSATSKPWSTCSQPNSISCFQTEIVATHAKQRRTGKGDFTLDIGSNSTVTLGKGDDTITGGHNNKLTIGKGDQSITLSGGNNTITLGRGDSTISVGGVGNTINLGKGDNTVHGGSGDTINITRGTLNITGTKETVFLSPSGATVNDFSTDLTLKIGPTAGKDTLTNFASDPGGVVDLLGGIGGFTSVAQVLSALKSDGHGGTLLSFESSHRHGAGHPSMGGGGHTSSLDFVGMAPSGESLERQAV
jgi:Ca2+-binding RTX toxin-like protein